MCINYLQIKSFKNQKEIADLRVKGLPPDEGIDLYGDWNLAFLNLHVLTYKIFMKISSLSQIIKLFSLGEQERVVKT